jgi:hypothetical protein
MATKAFRNLASGQLKPLTGVAQRSGAKSDAKRFDPDSTDNAPAGNLIPPKPSL